MSEAQYVVALVFLVHQLTNRTHSTSGRAARCTRMANTRPGWERTSLAPSASDTGTDEDDEDEEDLQGGDARASFRCVKMGFFGPCRICTVRGALTKLTLFSVSTAPGA